MKRQCLVFSIILLTIIFGNIRGLCDGSRAIFLSDECCLFSINGKNTITYYNTGEQFVIIPSKIAGYNIDKIGDYVFEDCTGIEDLIVPGTIKVIGNGAFVYCTKMENVTLMYGIEEIGDCSFSECHMMKRIVIPGTVKSVGEGAFNKCISLYTLIVEDGAELIGDSCFLDCWNLKYAYLPSSIVSIGVDAFKGCNSLTIYCDQDSVAEKYAIENGICYCIININVAAQ